VICERGNLFLSYYPLPFQNPRSPGTSPLGLASLNRKSLPIVVTLGGIGSCYASLALYLIAFYPSYKLCDNIKVARNVESKNMAMATRRTNPNIYRENNAPSSKTHQPTRLIAQQLEERKAKGLFFNFDSKYSKGHKCGEKKLFYIDCEEEEEQEQEPSQDENVEAILSEELTPTISCNALDGISTPQTLKIEGYIKKKKVIVLIDSGSTHNFIHYKLAKALNCLYIQGQSFK
jgi:hypothetical protein